MPAARRRRATRRRASRRNRPQRGGVAGPDPNADPDFLALLDKVVDTVKGVPYGSATITAMSALTSYVTAIPTGPMRLPYQAYATFLQNIMIMFTAAAGFTAGLGNREPTFRAAIKFGGSCIGSLARDVRVSTTPPNPYVASTTWLATVIARGTSPNWTLATAEQNLQSNIVNIATTLYIAYLYGSANLGLSDAQQGDIFTSMMRDYVTLLFYTGIMGQSGGALPAPIQTLCLQVVRSATTGKRGSLGANPTLLPTAYPITSVINRIPTTPAFTLTVPPVTLKTGAAAASGSATTASSATTSASGPATIQDVLALVSSAPDAKVAAAARSFMTSSGTLPGLLNNFISQLR